MANVAAGITPSITSVEVRTALRLPVIRMGASSCARSEGSAMSSAISTMMIRFSFIVSKKS